MNFSELGLSETLLKAVDGMGYETPTPIQSRAIPIVLSGQDLIGCAQTGTGKTAAFVLPMLNRLIEDGPAHPRQQRGNRSRTSRSKREPTKARALVLVPTRELAAQIEASMNGYGRNTSIRQTVIVGGVSQNPQVKALRRGVDALVATPGRLLDLMQQGHVDVSGIKILVLDEADQMLDMGFLPELKRIVSAVPVKRQTLLFSATMPDEIRQLAQHWSRDPVSVQVARTSASADGIAQSVHFVDKARKQELLSRLLRAAPQSRTLVFSRTKHGADKIVRRLNRDGLSAVAIHGNKSQTARNRALASFKSKRPPVLVATDIAARGLDIKDVSHVVNFDLPNTPETYVHRIGRTARAGSSGVAVSLCSGDERGLLKQIERLTKLTIDIEATIDGFESTQPAQPTHGSVKGNRPPKKGPRRTHAKKGADHSPHGKRTRKKSVRKGSSTSRPRKRRRQRDLAT